MGEVTRPPKIDGDKVRNPPLMSPQMTKCARASVCVSLCVRLRPKAERLCVNGSAVVLAQRLYLCASGV